ncbi:MAG: hypothetical protein KAT05_04040 [Spirochaetes bacterium]|nr:hypothetical protein [Spirochaetota bacterium]
MKNKTVIELTIKNFKACKLEEQLVGQPKYVEVEKVSYDQLNEQLKNNKITISITRFTPIVQNGNLRKIQLEISENIVIEPLNESVVSESFCKKVLIIGNKRLVWSASNDILKLTVDWLFQQGRIQRSDLPVYVLSGQRYLLNTTPRHSTDREFDGKPYNVNNASYDVYLNTNFSSVDIKKQAEYLVERFAPDVVFKILGFKN